MTEKRYDTEEEKKEILKGLEFFVSSEDSDLINPKEIKDLMDKLELKDKMPFVYNLIDSLSSSREIRRKGGLTKDEFITYVENKMNDQESKEGIRTIYSMFTDQNDDYLPMTNFGRTARDIGDNEKDQELKELLDKADMTGKELDFNEFYEIMKNDNETNENRKNLRKEKPKKYETGSNGFGRKYGKKEEQEPIEENTKVVKIEKEKNNPTPYTYVKVEETNVEHEKGPEETTVVTKIITTTTEEKVKEDNTNSKIRNRYKNRFNRDKNENEDKEKEKPYNYGINRWGNMRNAEKEQTKPPEPEEHHEEKDEGDSKRYHRRYRASYATNRPEEKQESTITYTKYRRSVI